MPQVIGGGPYGNPISRTDRWYFQKEQFEVRSTTGETLTVLTAFQLARRLLTQGRCKASRVSDTSYKILDYLCVFSPMSRISHLVKASPKYAAYYFEGAKRDVRPILEYFYWWDRAMQDSKSSGVLTSVDVRLPTLLPALVMSEFFSGGHLNGVDRRVLDVYGLAGDRLEALQSEWRRLNMRARTVDIWQEVVARACHYWLDGGGGTLVESLNRHLSRLSSEYPDFY